MNLHRTLLRLQEILPRAFSLSVILFVIFGATPAGAADPQFSAFPSTNNAQADHLVIALTAGDDVLGISGDATQTTIDYGGVATSYPNPIVSITVNAGGGDDTIHITGLTGPYPVSLYINGEGGWDTININSAASINTSAELFLGADFISIDTAVITTTGDQTYEGSVDLNTGTIITGRSIIFRSFVYGSHGLTVNALESITVERDIGGVDLLNSLTFNADACFISQGVHTFGNQEYFCPIDLMAFSWFTAETADIRFHETIDGGFTLRAESGIAGVDFFGVVGGTTSLGAIDVRGWDTNIHGDITTQGLQSYETPVEFHGIRVVRGGVISFQNTVDLNDDLILLGSGDIDFLNDVRVQTTGASLIIVRSDANVTFSGDVESDPAVAVWADDITFHGSVHGPGYLVLGATGVAEFAAASFSTYAGETTLDYGTTLVNGTLDTSGGLVTAQPGALLGGTGSIDRPVQIDGSAELSPGVSPGILSTGDLNQEGELIIEFSGNGGPGDPNGHDQVDVTGSVTIDPASAILTINSAGLMPWEVWQGATFIIIDNDGADAVTGRFFGLFEGGLAAANPGDTGFDLRISYTAGDGNDVALIAERTTLPDTGFPPDRITALPAASEASPYSNTSVELMIPTLGIRSDIVSIPRTASGWDVTWLWNEVGYLEESAFPTYEGNTVLSAHYYTPDGLPGPFIDLQSLRWGDVVQIRAWGQVYTYAVRANYLVRPGDMRPLEHKDHDWVTLVTCQGYDEGTESYAFRRVVQAVLVVVR